MPKTAIKKSKNKTVVRVAWNREAAEIFENDGWDAVKKAAKKKNSDISYDEVEFNTPAEAAAYARGIDDGNGWDEPYWEIKGEK